MGIGNRDGLQGAPRLIILDQGCPRATARRPRPAAKGRQAVGHSGNRVLTAATPRPRAGVLRARCGGILQSRQIMRLLDVIRQPDRSGTGTVLPS